MPCCNSWYCDNLQCYHGNVCLYFHPSLPRVGHALQEAAVQKDLLVSRGSVMGLLNSLFVIMRTQHSSVDGFYYCYPIPPLPTYSLVRVVCQFFIPVIIMFVSYSVASFKIREHMTFIEAKRQIRINSNLSTLNTYLKSQGNGVDHNLLSVPPSQPVIYLQTTSPRGSTCHGRRSVGIPMFRMDRGASLDNESSHMIETERDIIKMFYVIVLVFLVCYIPYQVCFILDHFRLVTVATSPYYYVIRNYVFLLTSFPSALHPLCYGTMTKFYVTRMHMLKIAATKVIHHRLVMLSHCRLANR